MKPRKKCKCERGCLKCGRRGLPLATVMGYYADYQAGMTFAAIARKRGSKTGGELRELFKRRGLTLRPPLKQFARQFGNGGCFVAYAPKTAREITEIISGMKRVTVPPPLRLDWRKWDMARRGKFITRVREHLMKNHGAVFAPTSPHSANVQPFDYCTPAARAIVEKMNAGKSSQECPAKLKPISQGMIFEGELYYWSSGTGYCNNQGAYDPLIGRPQLHRVVYEKHHGPIPAHHLVIQKDGNKNNFDPLNLKLITMADNVQRNHWRHLPNAHEVAKQIGNKIWTTRHANNVVKSRNAAAGLLQAFQTPNLNGDLLTKLKR